MNGVLHHWVRIVVDMQQPAAKLVTISKRIQLVQLTGISFSSGASSRFILNLDFKS